MMHSPGCHICGGALRSHFGAVLDPQTRETFAIEECVACGVGQTLVRDADLSRYYGDAYHGGRHGLTAAYCARRRLQLVARVAGAGRRLLDVGCGDGTFLLAARKQGWRVAGTEFNAGIARAAGLDVGETPAQVQEFGPFDCITLWHSLEHMRDPRALLKTLAQSLAPGGVLLVAVPDAGGLQSRAFGPKWFHLDVPRHLYHFGRRSLARLLELSGFRVTHRWYQEFEYDVMGWSQSALNAFMPAPNLFFNALTGRRGGEHGRGWKAAGYVLGVCSLGLAIPLTAVGALLRRGGTLVFAARREECD